VTADHHWRRIGRTARERAGQLLAALTFDEKVALALGDFEAVAHLGIPALRYADGPNGIRGPDNVTAFPASLALAATFDEGLAAAYGAAVAEEARDTGSNVLLGPAVDIARVPLGGRLPEALGEDPHLAGRLAAAEVRAIQDGHVIAMVKHFIAPDFMHAVRDPIAAANAGLDIPGLAVTEGRTAVDFTSGRIPAERLDDIVRRILFASFDAGLDQHPLPDRSRRPALASTPEPALTVVDPTVDLSQAPEGLTGRVFSARWTGTITPTVDGPHRFTVLAARIIRLQIDGALVAAGEREFGQVVDGPPLPVSGVADLRAGRPVGIRLDYSSSTAWPVLEPGVGGGNVRLGWQPPDSRIQEAAGLAAVLFGDADPGGRLPVTFPATPGQGPITGPERRPGTDGDARYDEGVLVGYRWYDQHGQEPLFCFGHGLSYGEYQYGQLRLQQDEATGAVTVSLQITNVGGRTGAEVVQLYLAAPAAAQQPPRQLKGFAKVHLDPGATSEVSLRLDRDDLAAFDEATGAWILHDGRYEVLVGHSSRDLRGRAQFEVGTRTLVRA
jgi:hypothetical protein